jgi:hypothetical protein
MVHVSRYVGRVKSIILKILPGKNDHDSFSYTLENDPLSEPK